MSWFSDRLSWSYDQLEYNASRPVTVLRGGSQSAEINAVAAEIEYEVIDRQGFLTSFLSRDYFIRAEDYVIQGVETRPRAGDRIADNIDGVNTYFVLIPVGSRPEAELKGDGLRWRLHTKRVE